MIPTDPQSLARRLEADLTEVVTRHGDAPADAVVALACVKQRAIGSTRASLEDGARAVLRQLIDELDQSYDDADRDAIRLLFGLAAGSRGLPAAGRYDLIVQRYRAWNAQHQLDRPGAHGRKPTGARTIRQDRQVRFVRLIAEKLAELEHAAIRDATLEGLEPSTERASRRDRVVSWSEFDEMAHDIATRVRPFRPDLVVGLARGGLPLAVRLAHALDVRRFGTIVIHKYLDNSAGGPVGRVRFEGLAVPDGPSARVLVVDDIVAVGDTMRTAAAQLRASCGPSAVLGFASLFADVARLRARWPEVLAPGSTFVYGAEVDNSDVWLTFPWERTAS